MVDLNWKRTGKITLRSEPYLIIKYSKKYQALYGEPGKREVLGDFSSADEAKSACVKHRSDLSK